MWSWRGGGGRAAIAAIFQQIYIVALLPNGEREVSEGRGKGVGETGTRTGTTGSE